MLDIDSRTSKTRNFRLSFSVHRDVPPLGWIEGRERSEAVRGWFKGEVRVAPVEAYVVPIYQAAGAIIAASGGIGSMLPSGCCLR